MKLTLYTFSDLTEEEVETLTTMKTERLKEDADASKGFVISFDDEDKPKKPKPELKNRRLSSTSAPTPNKKHSMLGKSGFLNILRDIYFFEFCISKIVVI